MTFSPQQCYTTGKLQSFLGILSTVQMSYHSDFLINKWPRPSGSHAAAAELQAEPSAGFRAADDKEWKQTVGTFPLTLIEVGAFYRLGETSV